MRDERGSWTTGRRGSAGPGGRTSGVNVGGEAVTNDELTGARPRWRLFDMSDDGQRTGRQDAALRYAGSLRCRPLAGAAADPGPEGWRFDILQEGAGIVVTEVAGEIDLRTVGILRKRLFELTDAGF